MSNSIDEPVHFKKDGDVAVLTMQLAPHNLLGNMLSKALMASLKRAEAEKARAVVVRSGLRHFSAGADLTLFDNHGARLHVDLDTVGLLRAFEELPIPIVASVHGISIAGGFEIALAADFIIAASSAKLGLVETSLGLHPLMGGLQRIIDRAGVARAKEMVMLGRRYDAATLERWNIINRVVPDADLQTVTMTVARELAAGPTVAHGATKRLALLHLNEGSRASDKGMQDIHAPILSTADLERGLEAFRASGPGSAVFEGN
ncbi:enoyl-CoA hydratase/isomerase family protein [Trinickia mobilis]|uniref:enoyl-CoA hydratase/isomerase family protein n=1 Tax=Trinickia mobilis TaxID=2816356 RepID=UPI001A8CBC43|nr:enoyl-CoA hydratase/isomerase family protein [Trinickia mobilis]